jgi:hypothetical protein
MNWGVMGILDELRIRNVGFGLLSTGICLIIDFFSKKRR